MKRILSCGRPVEPLFPRPMRCAPSKLSGGVAHGFAAEAPDVFSSLTNRIEDALKPPDGHVLLRGLIPRNATATLVALSSMLGTIAESPGQPMAQIVRTILPCRDRKINGRVRSEFLHTDGTDWPQPNSFTCLLCVASDQRGEGASRMLDLAVLREVLASPGLADMGRPSSRCRYPGESPTDSVAAYIGPQRCATIRPLSDGSMTRFSYAWRKISLSFRRTSTSC